MHVLLVDDEINILRALRRCILTGRPVDDDLPVVVETFTSASKAIQRMDERDFDVVISDYRMPEMNGVEFLRRAAEANPAAHRLLLSACADREAIVAAINDAGIVHFVEKPWDDAELRAIIDRVLHSPDAQHARADFARSRLETECPGITRVRRNARGAIMLDSKF